MDADKIIASIAERCTRKAWDKIQDGYGYANVQDFIAAELAPVKELIVAAQQVSTKLALYVDTSASMVCQKALHRALSALEKGQST